MHHPTLHSAAKELRQRATASREPVALPTDADRCGNGQIKLLLKTFGLRTSLIRLKVIDTLLNAAHENRPVGVRGVHTHLEALGIPLSFLSVREVLKRLCVEGVIDLNEDKSYRLTAPALAILEGS
ncbi:MAG: fe2+ zn2+ uptake regulation protein [Pseudomonas sp.]|nr:fe2+ zn2+ uptake regulation protein [Pseudomonas sp.]